MASAEQASEIGLVGRVVDCDGVPFNEQGFFFHGLAEHREGGKFRWDPAKVRLHLSPNQQGGKRIEGNKLRKELANQPVFNACLLAFFEVNPELIPKEWDGKNVFCWGTISYDRRGFMYVYCLCQRRRHWWRSEKRWRSEYRWVGDTFGGNDYAAMRADIRAAWAL